MNIRQIETGRMSPLNLDCAFLWLYCLDGQPYQKYLEPGAPATMPMVLVLLRWDGMFGTMGGKMDPGESLREALTREASEEANFWLANAAEPEALGTFQDCDWHVHSFAMEVSHAELVEARAKASVVSHATPECAGWCIIPTGAYQPGEDGARGVEAFRGNRFVSTAKLEFDALLALIQRKQVSRESRAAPTPATIVLEGEVLPPESALLRQARDLVSRLQAH